VRALIAASYTADAVNSLQVARSGERHATSGTKSDAGDAHVLAELVQLDRAHRPVARTPRSPSASRCSPAPISR
jgi:hypothetical protein